MKIQQTSPVVISLLITLLAATAWSGEDDDRKKKAAEYFQKGEILFDSREYAKAAQAFQLAYDMSPHPAVLANIAVSYDKAGKITDAVRVYRLYAPHAGSSKEDKKMMRRLKKLEAKVGEIDIKCSVTPCALKINGIESATDQTSIVSPGSYEITASAAGYLNATKTISVSAGRVVELHLTLEPIPEETQVPLPPEQEVEESVAPPPPAKPVLGVPFWVATGTTGAAAVVAIVFGVRTAKLGDEFEAGGSQDKSLKDEGKTSRLITNIMIGVTAGAAAAAIGFAIYDVVTAK